MFYDTIFSTFDSIPTLQFFIIFSVIYNVMFPVVHLLLSCHPQYLRLHSHRQGYVQCKLLEVLVFMFLCYVGGAALIREDINLFDTTNHKQNPQVMINMATVNCVKDMVEMVRNKLMTRTTLVHHTCVILAYCHVLTFSMMTTMSRAYS